MRLRIELESPFTWEDLISLIHLISDDLDDFEVAGTGIVGNSLVIKLVQKEPDDESQESQEPEQCKGQVFDSALSEDEVRRIYEDWRSTQ